MRRLLAIVGLLATLPSCGASVPTRYVLERDIDHWSYRRYQRVLDVEIPIAGRQAVGHTATYVRRDPRSRSVPFANVFVTVYDEAAGLAAAVRDQVRSLASYDTDVRAYGGGWVYYLDGGPGDSWALWVSAARVVKVGAGAELDQVPEDLVSAYMGIYPSDLDEHGRARPGTLSEGDAPSAGGEEGENGEEVPHYLQDDAPR